MNTRILLLALSVAALSSCSSAYRSGQTPDDVYYSPSRQLSTVARNNNSDDEYLDVRQPKSGTNYQSYDQYMDGQRDDRFLRMSVGNPYYMDSYNSYSGFDWRYNSLYYGYNYGFYSPWNNYFAWNNFYNPYSSPYSYYGLGLGYGGYYGGGYYGTGGGYYGGGGVKYTSIATPISRPVTFNVNSYTNNRPASRSYSPNNSYYNNGQRYNNTNSNTNSGGNRSYYNNSNSGNRSSNTYTPANNNNSYTPARTYTPSSGGGGGGGSTGGGGGGGSVGRPGRGN